MFICVCISDYSSKKSQPKAVFLLGCDFFERRGEKRIDVGLLLMFQFFLFGWCPMFLPNFLSDFVERRGENPSASTHVRI